MYCILIKDKDNGRYRIYTNEIFTTEKETLDYVKRSKFKKNVKWKVEEFDSKYFKWWIQVALKRGFSVVDKLPQIYLFSLSINLVGINYPMKESRLGSVSEANFLVTRLLSGSPCRVIWELIYIT